MPAVRGAASKFLAQKWQEENFRMHRLRVTNATTYLDMQQPRQFPHLQLALNKLAIEEDRQNRYDRENEKLLKKISTIVKGHGTLDQWNQWTRKELHAQARERQQKKIERENEAMLKRLKATKPSIRRSNQMKDFQKHKQYKDMLDKSLKDFPTPREKKEDMTEKTSSTENLASPRNNKPESEKADDQDESQSPSSDSAKNEPVTTLPPIPNKKSKKKANNKNKNTGNAKKADTSDELKLPSIEQNQKISSGQTEEE